MLLFLRSVSGLHYCLQAWLKPKQAKKGKKGAEPKASSAADTSSSLSQDLKNCQDALRRGSKVVNFADIMHLMLCA
jgi:hypothetical protein